MFRLDRSEGNLHFSSCYSRTTVGRVSGASQDNSDFSSIYFFKHITDFVQCSPSATCYYYKFCKHSFKQKGIFTENVNYLIHKNEI